MMQTTYEYPLPNNGERYDLSEDELCNLLDKAYRKGFEDGKNVSSAVTTCSSSDKEQPHYNYYNPIIGIYHLYYNTNQRRD